jgi:hypothetical protein
MRRPVGVKQDLYPLLFKGKVFLRRVSTVATLPSALLMSDSALGASWAFPFQPVLPAAYAFTVGLGQPTPGAPGLASFQTWEVVTFDPVSPTLDLLTQV